MPRRVLGAALCRARRRTASSARQLPRAYGPSRAGRSKHLQVSTFSSRSDGLAAVVQLCWGGREAFRNGVPLYSPIQTTAPTSTKTRGLAFHPFAPFLRREAGGRQKLAEQSCICLVSQGGLLICISGVGTRRNKLAGGGSVCYPIHF